jgi:hypothetical protein
MDRPSATMALHCGIEAIRLQLTFFEIDSFARAMLTSRPMASLGLFRSVPVVENL